MNLKIKVFLLVTCLFLTVIIGAAIGATAVPPAQVVKIILHHLTRGAMFFTQGWEKTQDTIIWQLRFPRVLLAAMVGGSLSVSGVAFQGLLRNPLADPYTIGVSSGAAFFATLGIAVGIHRYGGGSIAISILALSGAAITVFIVYHLARVKGKVSAVALLLAGAITSAFFSATISFVMILSGGNLRQIVFWLMGSFANRSWGEVATMFPPMFIGSLIVFCFSRELNIMLVGEESAFTLGVNIEKTKRWILLGASLLTAGAVAVSGLIGFVGLMVPHIIRMVFGYDHRVLIPVVFLGGSIFMVWCDLAARVVNSPEEIPVGIITALLGAPFFTFLLQKKRGSL